MHAEQVRQLISQLQAQARPARLHCVPAIPEEALALGRRSCSDRQADEQVLLYVDLSEDLSLDPGLILTDRAIYVTELPTLRIALEQLLSETCIDRMGQTWLYVNDLLLCTMPAEAAEAGSYLLALLRAIRLLRFEEMGNDLTLKPRSDDLSAGTDGWLRELTSRSGEADLLAGKYRVLQCLGEGTYGIVSLARDVRLDKLVAIKQLTQHSAQNARSQARFIQEARVLSRLTNRHIAAVHSLDYCNGDYLLIMEYLSGGSLGDRLEHDGQQSTEATLRVAHDMLVALVEAHQHGVIHRDIKPGNILFDAEGRAKLTDFGIAHVPAELGGLHLTSQGAPLGTVLYMAPEQVQAVEIDGRCDLYALGAVLYRMLCDDTYLERHQCRSLHLAFQQILQVEPRPLHARVPGLDHDLSAFVHRLLAKAPDDRFTNASEALEIVRAMQRGSTATAIASTRSFPEPVLTTGGVDKYRKALKLVLADGIMVLREEEMLQALAAKWCISPDTAQKLQREALEQAGLCCSVNNILEVEEMVRIFLTDGLLQVPERDLLNERAAAYGLTDEVVANIIRIVANELGIAPPVAMQP